MNIEIKNCKLSLAWLGLLAFGGVGHAFANDRLPHGVKAVEYKASQKMTIRTSQSAPDEVVSGDSALKGMAIGVSTLESIGFVEGSLAVSLPLGAVDSLQLFFTIPRTSPSLNFSAMGLYKRTMLDHGSSGLHLGGGVGLGVLGGAFGFNVTALGGIHFDVPGISRLKVHFDAGPNLSWVSGAGTNLTVGALSPVLGLSLFYAL